MGICWYCHWGWPKEVAVIYKEALRRLNGDRDILSFGASHLVWGDENFDCAEWCLEHFNDYSENYNENEAAVVRWSLEELAKLPLNVREIIPEDYDDEHPELYPPTSEVVNCKSW